MGYQMDVRFFCGKTREVFAVEVYRKSTGVLRLGKSEGKRRGAAAKSRLKY